jgi:hypothetical protein
MSAGFATRIGGRFRATTGDKSASLSSAEVLELISDGVLAGDRERCVATPEACNWLRRQLLDDGFAGQHREERRLSDGTQINLAESPLARLAAATGSETRPFLEPHQVEAGERLRRLVERAQLRPRLTTSYDLTPAAARGRNGNAEIGDLAADARRQLARLVSALPRDCADVVLDVCGLEKGLQLVEAERGWPRRSAKLVLRIGLDQLAQQFGLDPLATGRPRAASSFWMEGGRPPLFAEPERG